MINEKDLKEGITLDNSINSIYSGKLTEKARSIVNVIINFHIKSDEIKQIKVNNRVYEVCKDYVKYYSLSGIGKYYYVNNWEQIYKYLTKPVKNGRRVKLLSSEELELSRKEKKAI